MAPLPEPWMRPGVLPDGWKDLNAQQRWQLPLPLAVFGTLRAGHRNHHLMQAAPIAATCRAFLPHFRAHGIELYFEPYACAPFEVFCYTPEDWNKVIGPVEALEEFVPGAVTGGYHRTLAWLTLLPEDFEHRAFALELDQKRDLALAPGVWPEFDRVACWIYSNIEQNRLARQHAATPLIWDNVHFV